MSTFHCRSCRKIWERKDGKNITLLGMICKQCKRRIALAKAITPETKPKETDTQLPLFKEKP